MHVVFDGSAPAVLLLLAGCLQGFRGYCVGTFNVGAHRTSRLSVCMDVNVTVSRVQVEKRRFVHIHVLEYRTGLPPALWHFTSYVAPPRSVRPAYLLLGS